MQEAKETSGEAEKVIIEDISEKRAKLIVSLSIAKCRTMDVGDRSTTRVQSVV